jgi:uroporphyrinogen decarboxylase
MTPREIVLDQIHHRETNPVPFTIGVEQNVKDRLDTHYGGSKWRDCIPEYIVRCSGPIGLLREPVAAPRVRDVFGTVWQTDKLPPRVVEPGLKTPSFDAYEFPTFEQLYSAESKSEGMAQAAKNSDAFSITGPGVCLWQSWYLRGFENTLIECIAEEKFYEELLDRFTELTIRSIEECVDIPADAIMMGDDWGNQRGVFIGPERWRKFFKPRYARIFEAIHKQDKIAIMHCCGSVADIMGDIVEIGLDVLESVQPEAKGMNPYELKRAWGDKITFWGGLGSQSTIPFGKPADIRREIQRLRSEMSVGGGYILAPAKPLRPETPTENAIAVVEEFLVSPSR